MKSYQGAPRLDCLSIWSNSASAYIALFHDTDNNARWIYKVTVSTNTYDRKTINYYAQAYSPTVGIILSADNIYFTGAYTDGGVQRGYILPFDT